MTGATNILTLDWFTTTVQFHGRVDVESLGFVVDGQPLLDWLRWLEPDAPSLNENVSCFSRGFPPKEVASSLKRLLGRSPSKLPEGEPLYLCPCGDPCCGGLAVRVHRENGFVHWKGFTLIGAGAPAVLDNMPSLRFEAEHYVTAMNAALALTR